MLAQRLSETDEILVRLNGECSAEYKYDGVRVQARPPPREHACAPGARALRHRLPA